MVYIYIYIHNIIILHNCCIRHAMPQRSFPWSRDAEMAKLFIRNVITHLKRHRRIMLQQTFFDSWRCGIPPTRVPPPARLNVSLVGHPSYRWLYGYSGYLPRLYRTVEGDFKNGIHAQLPHTDMRHETFCIFIFLTSLTELTVWYLVSVVTSHPLHCFSLSCFLSLCLPQCLSLSNFRLPPFSELWTACRHEIVSAACNKHYFCW